MRRSVKLAVVAVVAAACRRSEGTTRSDSAAPAAVAARCASDTSFRHTDPVGLVEEFVRRDAEGPFEREDIALAWHEGALDCTARDSSDHYEVITAFRVEPMALGDDSARVLIHRRRAWVVGADSAGARRLEPSPAEWTDTVLVVRASHGWRIHRIRPGAHRLPARALAELPSLPAGDRAALERAAEAPRSPR